MNFRFIGQSAIEYLMTYGWMLLVVAITGGAIFATVGNQSVQSSSGFESQDFRVEDFGISSQNSLSMILTDPTGETTVKKVVISDGKNNISYSMNADLSENPVLDFPGIEQKEGNNKMDIFITYRKGNLDNLYTSGTVTGSLSFDEDYLGWNILESYNFEQGGIEEWSANGPIEIRQGWLAQTCDDSSTTTEMSTEIYDSGFNYSEIRIMADAAPLDSWDNEFMRMEVNTESGWQQIGNEYYSRSGGSDESFPKLDCSGYGSERLYEFNGTIQASDLDSLRFVHGADQNNRDESLAVDNIVVMGR